jgi:uncharacterized membrane protein
MLSFNLQKSNEFFTFLQHSAAAIATARLAAERSEAHDASLAAADARLALRADLDRARIQVAERAAEAVVHFDEIGVLRAQLEVVRERLTAANCTVTALTLEGLATKGESDAKKECEAVCTSFFSLVMSYD